MYIFSQSVFISLQLFLFLWYAKRISSLAHIKTFLSVFFSITKIVSVTKSYNIVQFYKLPFVSFICHRNSSYGIRHRSEADGKSLPIQSFYNIIVLVNTIIYKPVSLQVILSFSFCIQIQFPCSYKRKKQTYCLPTSVLGILSLASFSQTLLICSNSAILIPCVHIFLLLRCSFQNMSHTLERPKCLYACTLGDLMNASDATINVITIKKMKQFFSDHFH